MAARENLNVTTDDLAALQEKTERIRNVCIVAHVDHGKYSYFPPWYLLVLFN
jgi:hypothetical protein